MANYHHFLFEQAAQERETKHDKFYQSLIKDDRNFVKKRIAPFPRFIQNALISRYQSHPDVVKANIEMRHITDAMNKILPPVILNHFNASEEDFRLLAEEYADICRDKVLNNGRNTSHVVKTAIPVISKSILKNKFENLETHSMLPLTDFKLDSEILNIGFLKVLKPYSKCVNAPFRTSAEVVKNITEKNSANTTLRSDVKHSATKPTENFVNEQRRNQAERLVYEKCARFVNDLGLTAPTPDSHKTLSGCLKRMQDKRWWLKNLRKLMVRKTEECMLHLNKVHKHAGIYCSNITASNRKYQKAQQLKMMENISLVNEHDQRYSLRDIYELNVSNPINRRNELMTRTRGFEDIAKEDGHAGEFITITCPSKYHCAYAKSGNRNSNWQGFTPQQSQQYLCGIWAKIRAELDRQEIRTYGLRVAEPQHDGTPHWHLMLFVQPEHLTAFRAVINHYAFEEDGDEKGARENRVKFVAIDPSKGSATGYVAKYICKNIDGSNLEEGVYGESPIEAAERVEAWASCWGIRQFQQIGGVSVTVWRELRRLRQLDAPDVTLTAIHQAADTSNWKSFVTLMGGVFCKRKEQTIRPHYDIEIDNETGLITTDYYDNFIVTKLKGICYLGKAIITRLHQWRLELDVTAFRSHLESCK